MSENQFSISSSDSFSFSPSSAILQSVFQNQNWLFFLRKMSQSRTFLSLSSSFRQLKSRKEHAHVIHRLEKPFGERKMTEIQSESRFGLSDSPINRNAIFQLNREGLITIKILKALNPQGIYIRFQSIKNWQKSDTSPILRLLLILKPETKQRRGKLDFLFL